MIGSDAPDTDMEHVSLDGEAVGLKYYDEIRCYWEVGHPERFNFDLILQIKTYNKL